MQTKTKKTKEESVEDGIVEVILTIPVKTKEQRRTFLKYFKNYHGEIKSSDLVQIINK